MPIMIAKRAGFCYGVRRAIESAYTCAQGGAGSVCTLGEIIHNPHVVNELELIGVKAVASPEDVDTQHVIIRAHGVTPDIAYRLTARGITIIDATCPTVKRTHEMVARAAENGVNIFVVGEPDHPEVEGILGYARGLGVCLPSVEDALSTPRLNKALVVSQTTISASRFNLVSDALRTRIEDLQCAPTLCAHTEDCRAEATGMAAKCDVMIIVGGKNSSNTRKLYEAAQTHCPRTYLVESADELPGSLLNPGETAGITAGASTPDCIFKEVVTRMNDMDLQNPTPEGIPQEADFQAEFEKTLVKIHPGQVLTGTVVQITEDEVGVDIGYKSDGLVKREDLVDKNVKIGDSIEVEVVKVNDGEGNVSLSQRSIISRKAWDELMAKQESGEYVDAVGKEAVKGGLLADIMGVRAFIPASQLATRFVENVEQFVGQAMKLKIIESDKAKKRIVASRKAAQVEIEKAKKAEAWAKLQVGDVIEGTVRRLADFGAFVDVGGVDGLIHITDLGWGRVRHPSDVVAPNQTVNVKVLALDPDRDRISLGLKQLKARPWESAADDYPIGSIVEGRVVRITTFGAFVELKPGLDGLVHISQCALTRVPKVEDALTVGQTVRVKVLDVNPADKRISLSVRQALEDEALAFDASGIDGVDVETDDKTITFVDMEGALIDTKTDAAAAFGGTAGE